MKTTIDCIPCFISHSIQIARMLGGNPKDQEKIVKKTLELISSMDFAAPPPLMAKKIHRMLRKISGVDDPYRKVKDKSTRASLKLLPFLRKKVAASKSPFETIIRLVIAGNIIDFGANHEFKLESINQIIRESLQQPIDAKAVKSLEREMDKAEKILYVADNCGELVFDRLLIEPYRGKITVVVRGSPILNDATHIDARLSGITAIAKVINTGDSIPGAVYGLCGKEYRKAYNESDLIISKGQGNFETISHTGKPSFFLFKAKCAVISRLLNTELGSLQILAKNLKK